MSDSNGNGNVMMMVEIGCRELLDHCRDHQRGPSLAAREAVDGFQTSNAEMP